MPSRSRPRPDERDAARDQGGPGERGRRPTSGASRGRGYNADGADGADGGGRSGSPRGLRGYDDRDDGWESGQSRGGSARGRGAPPQDDASEEMVAQRDDPRAMPGRRGQPSHDPGWGDDYSDAFDDPRSPQGRHGAGGRGAPDASRGRGLSRYDDGGRRDRRDARDMRDMRDMRRYDPPPGYTDEGPAAGFDNFDSFEQSEVGYSEEYPAPPRYPESRGPRSAPGNSRAPGGRQDGWGAYNDPGQRDDYGRGGAYGRSGPRSGPDQREMGGYDARYADDAGYNAGFNEAARGYPPVGRGGQAGYGQRDAYNAFDESSVWQPGGYGGQPVAPGGWGRAAQAGAAAPARPAKRSQTGKPRRNALALAFQLFVVVVVVVGLVAVVGPEFAPKLAKYLPFLASGSQATPPPTFATYTPGPTPTSLPNYKLYSSAAGGFAMNYPSAWATSTDSGAQNDTVYQFAQANSAQVVIVERAPALDSATDAQLVQAEVTGAQQQGVTLTEITSAATTEGIGGEVWQRREYQATNKAGVKLHIAVLACHHLGKSYVIALFGSDTGFATADTATYEPMLRSFRFL